jgi:hypothetical protein
MFFSGNPAIPVFVAPSVTPWRFKLSDGTTGPAHNPSLRLVTYDRATGRHLNLQQYRMDLGAALKGGSDAFEQLYSFTEVGIVKERTSAGGAVAQVFSEELLPFV